MNQTSRMDSYANSIPARYIENCIKHNGRVLPTVTQIFGEASRAEIPPTNLDFSNEYMSDKSAIAIMHTIAEKLPHLKSLSFKGCGIGEEAIVAMSEIFGGGGVGNSCSKDNGSVAVKCSDEASPSSSPSCSSSCLLQEINVLGNDLYASSGRALIALLRSNPRLYKIEVNTIEMPDRVATALRKAAKRNYDACFPPPPPPPVPDKYRSRERLDALIAEIGPLLASSSPSVSFSSSSPATNDSTALTLHAAKVRLLNYWNLRLGSFGVQFLLDNGFSVETLRKMMLIERRVRCVESVTDVRAVATFRSPLDTLEKELNLIGAQLADEKSLLSRLSALRDGGTIRMQYETCKELLALLSRSLPTKDGGYSEEDGRREGTGRREASSSAAVTCSFERSDVDVVDLGTAVTKLMVTMHHLRTSIAGVTLRDFYDETSRLAKLNATVTGSGTNSTGDERSHSMYSKQTQWSGDVKDDKPTEEGKKRRALVEVCVDFEQYIHSLASFLSLVVYESSRRLSLLCDEFKYFKTNHKEFAQAVAARGRTMSRMVFPSLLLSKSLPSRGPVHAASKGAAHAVHNEEEDIRDEEGDLTESAALAFGTLISESAAEEARTLINNNNNNSASCPHQQHQQGGGQQVDNDLSFLFSAVDAPPSSSSPTMVTNAAFLGPSFVELQRCRNELIKRLESLLSIPFCTAGPAVVDPAASVTRGPRTMGSASQKGDLSIIASLQSAKISETTTSASSPSSASSPLASSLASVRAGRVVVPEAPRVPTTLMSLQRGDDAMVDASSDNVLLRSLLGTIDSADKNDTSSCPLPTMVDFLRYYAVCRAHQGSISDDHDRRSSSSYWSSVAAYVHPFYRAEGPTLSSDPYAEFARPAVPDRPRPSRASEVYADVSAAVLGGKGSVSEGSSPTTTVAAGSTANSVGKSKAGFVAGDGDGLDVIELFASIGSKAELLTWFRQYSAFVRYLLVLGNGESIPSL